MSAAKIKEARGESIGGRRGATNRRRKELSNAPTTPFLYGLRSYLWSLVAVAHASALSLFYDLEEEAVVRVVA